MKAKTDPQYREVGAVLRDGVTLSKSLHPPALRLLLQWLQQQPHR